MSMDTKQVLADALVVMLNKKPVDKITVRDLVDECGLTRQTFYNHFADIYELVEWAALQAIKESLEEDSDYDTWQQGFYKLMIAIKDNKSLVLHTYYSNNRDILERYIYKVIYGYIIEVVERLAADMTVSENHKNFIAHFYSLAFIALIFEWVQDGMKVDPKEIVDQTGVLVQGDFKRALAKYAE